MRDQAPQRQQQNVDLGVAEEPEQVLEEDGVAAAGRIEEVCAEVAVGEQHGHRTGQHRDRRDEQEGCDQPAPGEERQLHHRHARRAQVEDGDDDVDRAEDRADAEDVDRENRKIHTKPALHRQRRVERPAGGHGTIADAEECQHERQRQ